MNNEPEMIKETIKHTLLNNISEFNNYSPGELLCEVKPKGMTDRKENFSSNIFTASVINQNTKQKTDLLVKVMPLNRTVRRYHNSDKQFQNEIVFYEKVIPTMIQHSRLRDKTFICSLFPRFHYGNNDSESAMIVLEDLTVREYGLASLGQTLDYEHIKQALDGLAHFHALSHAMKHENKSAFTSLVDLLVEARFGDLYCKRSEIYLRFTSMHAVKNIHASKDPNLVSFRSANEDFLRKLEIVLQQPVTTLKRLVRPEETLSVLCHGDFYRNNILYRYINGNLNDVKFVDFQLVRYASAATDIAFLLYLNTTAEFRQKHLNNLIESYRKTMVDCLVTSDLSTGDWENILSLEELKKSLERHALYGFINSAMFLHLLLATQEETQRKEELKAEETDEEVPSDKYLQQVVLLGGDEVLKRSVGAILEMARMDQKVLFSKALME